MGSIRGEILLGALQLNNYYKIMAKSTGGISVILCGSFYGER